MMMGWDGLEETSVPRLSRKMRNGNLIHSIEGLSAGRYIMHRVKYVGAVISQAASVAHADGHALEYDKSLLVLERFLINLLGPNGPFAVFARLAV
jgi:hypothetical protein